MGAIRTVRHGQSPEQRLWAQCDKLNGPVHPIHGRCWVWTGCLRGDNMGYGQITVNKKPEATHRLAWVTTRGPIPNGKFVCHKCDNPVCMRPVHLFLGTCKDNLEDASSKNRMFSPKGELNNGARLAAKQVLDIRRLAAAGVTRTVLARKFGVSLKHVHQIVLRYRWKHI